jgi:hypothetical protein
MDRIADAVAEELADWLQQEYGINFLGSDSEYDKLWLQIWSALERVDSLK